MSQPLDDMTARDLFDEAERLLRRWSVARLPNHDVLVSSIDALRPKPVDELLQGDPLVEALRTQLTTAWLYEHRLNLKPGSRRMTYACVAISVLLMFVVGSLSVVYNKGVALLAEVEALAATQPDRRFGQLERQLLVAQNQLFAPVLAAGSASGKCPDNQSDCNSAMTTTQPSENKERIDELAQESTYVLLHELRDLNLRLTSLEVRTLQFSSEAATPLPIIAQVSARLGAVFDYLRPKSANAAGPEATSPAPDVTPKNSDVPWRRQLCEESKDGPNEVPSIYGKVLGMDMIDVKRQACRLNIDYTSITVPSVRIWATTIKDSIAGYSLWVLPCLYAALGSMIYFMRLILDPAQPNPASHRIVHRIALAALAGMALGWFWEPTIGKDPEFHAAGVGLFTFAFIVGFSIDVFYAMLDRLVALSSSAISRIGT